MNRFLCLLALSPLAACHHGKSASDGSVPSDMSVLSDGSASRDGSGPRPDAATCTRSPRADGPRFAVVSHPFDTHGNPAADYEVLALATDGTFTRPNTHFQMMSSTEGTIVFTPDGKFGYVPQGNSHSIGIFTISDTGAVTVVNPSYVPGRAVGEMHIDAAGEHMYLVDGDTTNNGGGIYDLSIACDGTLGEANLVVSADVPTGLALLPGGDFAMYARSFSSSPAGDDVHRFTLAPYARTASGYAAFAASPNVGSAAATHDGKYYLAGDNSGFSSPNSIAIASLASGVTGVTTSAGDMGSTNAIQLNDPYAMIASPFDNAVLVVSGFGNAFFKLPYDPSNTTTPFGAPAELTYKSGNVKPQLPGNAQLIDHGALANHVFVSELNGVRQLQFEPDGTITDLGLYDLGGTNTSLLGVVGVQP